MQTWDYEKASIHKRENAKALQCAVDQASTDLPYAKVTEAALYSKIVPLPNAALE